MGRSPCAAVALFLVLGHLLTAQAPNAGPQIALPPAPGAPGSVQRPGLPPRDPRAGTPTGTARLRGRVVSQDTGAPLRRAQVSVFANDLQFRRVTTTDGEGRYDFVELPAGRYSVNANKAGFVSLQYGQRRPFEPGTPVIVADGQAVSQIDFVLPRGGVIAGRIADEFGEPIAQAQVRAQRYQYGPDGQRRMTMSGMATTDDLGQFRVFGLMPGEYVVSAGVQSPMMIPTAGNANDVSEGYPPTYFPGTLNASDAQAVTVAIGQEASVQMSLLPARMARISGTVVDSQNRPVAGAMLMMRMTEGGMMMGIGGGQTAGDGSFTLSSVAPGQHVIDIRPQRRSQSDETEFASMPITVAGSDITGLRIITNKGATITGRVVWEGTSPRTGGQQPTRVLPMSTVAGMPFVSFAPDQASGMVDEDGSFTITSVSGSVNLRVNTPPGWTLKSVALDNEDITDESVEINGTESVEGVRIVLTDKLTDVSGQVTDARGQPLKEYVLVIVPSDAKQGPALQRFTRLLRGDQDGRFRQRGLPPGRYVAAAVESLEQGAQFSPEVQRRLREAGRSFSVREGETLVLDLKLTTGI